MLLSVVPDGLGTLYPSGELPGAWHTFAEQPLNERDVRWVFLAEGVYDLEAKKRNKTCTMAGGRTACGVVHVRTWVLTAAFLRSRRPTCRSWLCLRRSSG